MNKAGNIYWDSATAEWPTAKRSSRVRRRPAKAAENEQRTGPWWLSFVIVTSIFVMLCISINYRAFSAAQEESDKNARLAVQIQSLTDENLALQEEIHTLKTDPRAIKREAKRIGIALR